MTQIRAFDVDCADTALKEAATSAAVYQDDIAMLLCAIKGAAASELMLLVLLATLADPALVSRAMALVRPPDTLW